MEWEGREQSGNVEDRRGGGAAKKGLVVGGGASIIVVIVALVLGVDPASVNKLLNPGGQGAPVGGGGGGQAAPLNDKMSEFVSVVLKDTEDVWHAQFRKMGKTYREPKLVLFTDKVQSGCGLADAGIGPFYCPADQTVYLDPTFFQELASRFKAPGDFAQAYVIAHEVGHHVQNLLGYTQRVHSQQGKISKVEYNHLSVRLELQADCLAGIWGYHAQRTKQVLQPGDMEEALNAANAIGDDRLQKQARGQVQPDSFTHGTSAQRIRWFKMGFDTGDIEEAKKAFELPYEKL